MYNKLPYFKCAVWWYWQVCNQYHNQITSVTSKCFSLASFMVSYLPQPLTTGNHWSSFYTFTSGFFHTMYCFCSWATLCMYLQFVPFYRWVYPRVWMCHNCFSMLNDIYVVSSFWLLILLLCAFIILTYIYVRLFFDKYLWWGSWVISWV